jgi:hypothetical protein
LGFGYATCSTEAATTAKVATLSGYSLVTNGIVSVKFTNSVPANATLNINNKGAKNIYYQGAKIVAGVIKAGDIATFVYSGNYNLICIDRGSAENVVYDNSQSGLSADNVQGAIDELSSAVGTQSVMIAITPPATSAITSFGGIFYIRKGNNAILMLNAIRVASAGNNQYLFSIPDISISNMLVVAGGLGSKTNGIIFISGKDVYLSNSESDNPTMVIYATVNLILR